MEPTTNEKISDKEETAGTEATTQQNSIYDELLSKYIAVWIWSIMFGSVSGLFYSSSASARGYSDRWVAFIALSLITSSIGLVAVLIAYRELYKCLKEYLLPRFFMKDKGDTEAFVRHIKNAFLMLFVALLVRILSVTFEMVLTLLQF